MHIVARLTCWQIHPFSGAADEKTDSDRHSVAANVLSDTDPHSGAAHVLADTDPQ